MQIYRVGGSVRDECLGLPASDHDFVVIAGSESQFMHAFPQAVKVGGRHAVFIVQGREYTLSPAPTIEADLLTRDLTINAMARDRRNHLIAHPHARVDLENRVLRPVAPENFVHDPLRIFRAARFSATLPDFSLHPTLIPALQAAARPDALNAIAAERVGREVIKACNSARPSRFMQIIAAVDAWIPWFSELATAESIPAGPKPYHDESVLAHISLVADRLAGDGLAVWMGLCHDLGKTATPSNKWPSHHGHDRIGQPLAELMGQRLRLPRRLITAGAFGARWHMVAAQYNQLRPATRVKLLMAAHKQRLLSHLADLVLADHDIDISASAQADLARIQAVHLPSKFHGSGIVAGQRLFELRCQALRKN